MYPTAGSDGGGVLIPATFTRTPTSGQTEGNPNNNVLLGKHDGKHRATKSADLLDRMGHHPRNGWRIRRLSSDPRHLGCVEGSCRGRVAVIETQQQTVAEGWQCRSEVGAGMALAP
jgi:hypothetical protein